jgi:putative acetyltransferase
MANVSVRHAEPDDAPAIHRILSGPRAIAGTMQLPLQSLQGLRSRFFSETREGLYHLVGCIDEEVVGHLGLETFTRPRRRHAGEIGMAVRDNWLNLTRVELSVYTDNTAGVALYKKFGFEVEGTHRRYAFRNGQYVDAYSMARIR